MLVSKYTSCQVMLVSTIHLMPSDVGVKIHLMPSDVGVNNAPHAK